MQDTVQLEKGDIVRIVTFNPAFHGLLAEVDQTNTTGAHLLVPMFRQGMKPAFVPYRADSSELIFVAKGHEVPEPDHPIPLLTLVNGKPHGRLVENTAEKRMDSQAQGYTGDPCPKCGSLTLRRTGICTMCDTCLESSGCS